MALIGRWSARADIRKRFEEGTAKFNPDDVKRRRDLIRNFFSSRGRPR
jgi:hypothetical protein